MSNKEISKLESKLKNESSDELKKAIQFRLKALKKKLSIKK